MSLELAYNADTYADDLPFWQAITPGSDEAMV